MPVIEPWPLFTDSSNSNDYIFKEKNGFLNIFKFTMQKKQLSSLIYSKDIHFFRAKLRLDIYIRLFKTLVDKSPLLT